MLALFKRPSDYVNNLLRISGRCYADNRHWGKCLLNVGVDLFDVDSGSG
jgi:hypothetical protein